MCVVVPIKQFGSFAGHIIVVVGQYVERSAQVYGFEAFLVVVVGRAESFAGFAVKVRQVDLS